MVVVVAAGDPLSLSVSSSEEEDDEEWCFRRRRFLVVKAVGAGLAGREQVL